MHGVTRTQLRLNVKDTKRRRGVLGGGAAAFRSAMAIVVFAIMPLLALAAAPPGRDAAQKRPHATSLQIEIWPEFDRRSAALVILKGELAANVALPASVSLRIPASSGAPTAVAFATAPGTELFNLAHDRTYGNDFITLRFEAPQRFFHVEFYDPVVTGTPDRTYTYVWPGDLAVERLSARLQEPAASSNLSVQPGLRAGVAGPDGLLYRTANLGALEAGKQLSIEIRYTKRDARTSAEILGLKTPDSERPPTFGANEGLPGWVLGLATVAVLSLAAVAISLWWRRRKTATAATQRGGRIAMRDANSTNQVWMLVFASWLIAAIATLGALFFGEVMKVPTCALCWYQRIFMFPLVLILPVGLFPFDPRIVRYAIPLALGGWAVALFHVLVVAGYIPENVQPCTQGVPCSETYIQWFGFVTIPLLALVAFSLIIALLAAAHLKEKT